MAFVALGGSSFLGGKSSPVEKQICRVSQRPAAGGHRMSFSSIDMPAAAISLTDSSVSSREQTIAAAYKQIFGNAYLMEEERAELARFESDFKFSTLSTRELVRAFGKSEAYRKRFFARSGPYRFVELNCKHFLGRGPIDQEEVSFHVQKLINEGYDSEIDSYIDSEEYEEYFGSQTVPRFVFKGTYRRNDEFNRMMLMRQHWDGCSTSTVSGSTAPGKPIPARLTMGRGEYVTGFVGVAKGLPAGFRPEGALPKKLAPVPKNSNAGVRMRVKVAENLYQVFEIPPLGTLDVEPEWKKELAGTKKWNGAFF